MQHVCLLDEQVLGREHRGDKAKVIWPVRQIHQRGRRLHSLIGTIEARSLRNTTGCIIIMIGCLLAGSAHWTQANIFRHIPLFSRAEIKLHVALALCASPPHLT
ncbi:hypothetical protein CAOG_009901 [Capsaspora owczarzaki ATCC 30864]|uniref:Uncharacterized protein n=1 Tax=Capsaspora owczarzaki (strain ATCC 30864) TaxID=595528 RepID=A0A0D2VV15_CAPO3|nr:hypothetical protein CAOG_009901 [Capsaspora owczarzaki ATCC 30864]